LEGAPGPDAFGDLSDAFHASDPVNTYRRRTRTVGRSEVVPQSGVFEDRA
jgi:hypothetical protein